MTTPELLSSPLTGDNFGVNYSAAAFESDTPRIEAPDLGGICNRTTGEGCTIVPPTDDGQPATFYPFFSITSSSQPGGCRWFIGNDVPGLTASDFGKDSQYGTLLSQVYLAFGGHGATLTRFNDFQNNLGSNPCKAWLTACNARAHGRRTGAATMPYMHFHTHLRVTRISGRMSPSPLQYHFVTSVPSV